MEVPGTKYLCMFMCALAAFATSFRLVSSSSSCQPDFRTFLHDLNSQCPSSISSSSSPIQVDRESLDRAISSNLKNEHIAVLFYASWCPFSNILLSKFYTLSSMYPRIKHLMVEQTSVLPSVFSRYGIHSVPAILIVKQRTQIRYHGQKDLKSLVNFYKRTTGLDPIVDMVEDAWSDLGSDQKVFWLWDGASLEEIFWRETYLVLSIAFVLLRAFLYFFPGIASHIRAMWVAYIPHLNLGIFGESRQLIGRMLHPMDVKRILSKLKLCKTRNLHQGARNARVWASSLASVSLGESSSPRVFPSRDL